MKLSDIVVSEAIIPQLSASTRDEVIKELVESLAAAGAITKKKVPSIAKAVIARENQATTGMGRGVALPHVKFKGIKKPICTIGQSAEGLDFSSLDSKPVYSVILLLSNPDDPDTHLQAMETVFKHIQRDMFRRFLRQSLSKKEIIDLTQEADELG